MKFGELRNIPASINCEKSSRILNPLSPEGVNGKVRSFGELFIMYSLADYDIKATLERKIKDCPSGCRKTKGSSEFVFPEEQQAPLRLIKNTRRFRGESKLGMKRAGKYRDSGPRRLKCNLAVEEIRQLFLRVRFIRRAERFRADFMNFIGDARAWNMEQRTMRGNSRAQLFYSRLSNGVWLTYLISRNRETNRSRATLVSMSLKTNWDSGTLSTLKIRTNRKERE